MTHLQSTAFAAIFVTGLASSQAQADGPFAPPDPKAGIRGANRRVITEPGNYVGIRGTFSVPSIKIPNGNYAPSPPASANLARFANANGNSANSKPGFYLGCSQFEGAPNNLEVDAGVIYEYTSTSAGNGNDALNPGYAIFVRTSGGNASKGTYIVPDYWRACVGYSGPNAGVTSFDLTWRLYRLTSNGIGLPAYGGFLKVNAFGATTQPNDSTGNPGRIYAQGDGNSRVITYTPAGMAVKRVTAMNQGGSVFNNTGQRLGEFWLTFPQSPNGGGVYEEDGSFMKNSVFSNGQALSLSVVPGEYSTYDSQPWPALSTAAIKQKATNLGDKVTGYYPPGQDQSGRPFVGLGPRSQLATSRYIIDFPEIGQSPVARDSAGDNSRYDNEKIDINLRRRVIVKGKLVLPGGVVYNVEN